MYKRSTAIASLNFDAMDVDELLARQKALWVAHDDKELELKKLKNIYGQILEDLLAIERALEKHNNDYYSRLVPRR